MAIISITAFIFVTIVYFVMLKQNGMGRWLFAFPFTLIIVQFFIHFRLLADSSKSMAVDISIGLSAIIYFLAFFMAYYFPSESYVTKTAKYLLVPTPLRIHFTSHLRFYTIILTVIFLFLFWSWRIQLYGSFTEASLAMYSRISPENEEKIFVSRIPLVLYQFICVLLSYRFFLQFGEKRDQGFNFIDLICIVLLIFSIATTGSRGCMFILPLLFLFTGFIAFANKLRFQAGMITRVYVVSISCLCIFLGLTLGSIRGARYDSFGEVLNDLNFENQYQGLQSIVWHGDFEGKSNYPANIVAQCMEMYGNEVAFLGLHYTPYTMAVNPIPRIFWESKPMGFGRVFVLDYHNLAESSHSVGAGTFGEGYAAWGYAGGVIYTLIFAAIAGLAARFYVVLLKNATYYIEHWIFALLFFNFSILFVRGDMLSAWVTGAYPLIIAIVCVFTLRTLFSLRPKTIHN